MLEVPEDVKQETTLKIYCNKIQNILLYIIMQHLTPHTVIRNTFVVVFGLKLCTLYIYIYII